MPKSIGPLVAIALFLAACRAQATDPAPETAAPVSSPGPAFTLATLNDPINAVDIRPAGAEAFAAAKAGDLLSTGHQVRTGPNSRARLDFSTTGTVIRLAPNTEFTLMERTSVGGSPLDRLQLKAGKIWVSLSWGTLEVETPVGLASVRGSFAVFDYQTGNPATLDDDVLILDCLEGICALSRGGTGAALTHLERFVLTSTTLVKSSLTAADVDDFLRNNPDSARLAVTLTALVPTLTPTNSATPTPSETLSPTPSRTPTLGPTATSTNTPPNTATRTVTPTSSRTLTPTASATPTPSLTPTPTTSRTPTPSSTATSTSAVTNTPSATTPPTTLVVSKTADTSDGVCDTDCSLREAIITANNLPGPNTITLPAGQYDLTIQGAGDDGGGTGDLDITGDLTINGAGANTTFVDGFDLDERILHVISGIVTLNDLTLQWGNDPNSGGAILNAGTLTLNRAIVANSDAQSGGGIANNAGALLTLSQVAVVSNTVSSQGGGIYNLGVVNLTNVTLSGNAGADGGGLYNNGAATLTHVTLAANTAGSGSNIFQMGSATATLNAALVVGGAGSCNAPVTAANNSIQDGTTCFSGGTNHNIGAGTAGLDPLGDYGGQTLAHRLQSGSPARNPTNAPASCPATDQRGLGRPAESGCDIGAVEYIPGTDP